METNKKEIFDPKGKKPLPNPIPARLCQCGCGNYFYPTRKDNIYLNKQHADFAYNNGKRKTNNSQRLKEEKILLKNDNLLHKHFTSKEGQVEIEQYYDILKADGFKSAYHIGRINKNQKEYYISYTYMYQLFKINEILKIKIRKR